MNQAINKAINIAICLQFPVEVGAEAVCKALESAVRLAVGIRHPTEEMAVLTHTAEFKVLVLNAESEAFTKLGQAFVEALPENWESYITEGDKGAENPVVELSVNGYQDTIGKMKLDAGLIEAAAALVVTG